MIYLLLIINIVLTFFLYRKIVHKIMVYSFWLRKHTNEDNSNYFENDSIEIQKKWDNIFGKENPDKKTQETRVKILEELEETEISKE